MAHDGLVYVCDRGHNRVHIFETDGTFVEELFVERATPAPWQFDLENNRYPWLQTPIDHFAGDYSIIRRTYLI